MGIDYQLHRASVNMAKGYREVQKAETCLSKDDYDGVVKHLNKGYDRFGSALDHAAKAEDQAYAKAGSEIDKGNRELRQSIDDYAGGRADAAHTHYAKAVKSYDSALDLME